MMKRLLTILFGASALVLSACLARSQPTATATPQPLFTATQSGAAATATPAAPATAAATALSTETAPAATQAASGTPLTPSPTAAATASAVPATATPAVSPTPDPNEAVGDVVYQDKLDGTGGWFWTFSDPVATFGVTNGKLKGLMKAANSGWRFTISQDSVQLGSQQVQLTTHTVSCGQNDEYGLMLRLKTDADNTSYDGYLFKVRCGGAASFEAIQGINRRTIVDWTPSPAIQTGAPADNTLMVWSAGSDFRFYANGQYLFSAQDSALTGGFYGIYLYDRTAGGETVNFDTLVARAVNK